MEKYILQFGQIHFAIWANKLSILEKSILQFGQIHFEKWTNILQKFWADVSQLCDKSTIL